MSTRRQKPTADTPVEPAGREAFPLDAPGTTGTADPPETAARLRAIHDLVRSGDYHVPANTLAECMIDRLMAGKRDRRH